MSNFRFILRKIFLIVSGLTVLMPLSLMYIDERSVLLEAAAQATIFGASCIGALVILYILEIEKKK